MKSQIISTDASWHSSCMRPEFRGNLVLGLLLGINLLIALPSQSSCAYAQTSEVETVNIQSQSGC